MSKITSDSPYMGSGQITREQFLFYETRTVARLKSEGLSNDQVLQRISDENLFQYPTEKTIKRIGNACLRRLESLNDDTLVQAIAQQPSDIAKQICLFAMMKQYRLIWDYMVTVVGEKYRQQNISYSKLDCNTFFLRLQEQDDLVASWSENTVTKIKQVLTRVLIENEYLDEFKSDHLNPVMISSVLENAIRSNGDELALSAFNCLL